MTRTTLILVVLAMCCVIVWTQAHVSSGGRIALGISGTPAPGTSFALECTLTADVDTAAVASGEVSLFNGLRTLTGDSVITFNVAIEPGLPTITSHNVIAEYEGVYHIRAQFTCTIDTVFAGSGNEAAWIGVSADPDSQGVNPEIQPLGGLMVTTENPAPYEISYVPIEPSPMDSTMDLGEGNDGNPSSTFDVTLRLVFYDFRANELAPIVNLPVELWDSDDGLICGHDDFLGRGVTDDDGIVVFSDVDSGDCLFGDVEPYIRAPLENSIQRVVNGDGNTFTILKAFPDLIPDLGTFEVDRTSTSRYASAVFDKVNKMWSLLHSAGYDMPKIQIGLTFDGRTAFYLSPARIIARTSDVDAFDVIGHEYGHAVMHWKGDYASFTDAAGFDVITNVSTGWQEGFASFLPVALADDGKFDFAIGSVSMERLLPLHQTRTSTEALKTQGLVARALYDMYDTHVDVNLFPWQVGADVYVGGVEPIMDVLVRSNFSSGFNHFWTAWHAWGANPGQDPIRSIRLNMINLNTAPSWATPTAIHADPFEDVVLDLWGLAADGQSRDSELVFSLVSVSNVDVYHESLDNGRRLLLNLPTQTGVGSTSVTISASDMLATTNVTRNIFWGDEGGGGGGPKEPCEYPCQGTKPPSAVLSLDGAYPNPFRDVTNVGFSLPDRQWMTLAIYDVNGHRVRTLAEQTLEPGLYQAPWDGKDDVGHRVPSGVYFGVLRTRGDQLTSKIIVLR